jgi:hypothetical protein
VGADARRRDEMELAELRKRLKALGFRIKTQSMSHGIHATIMDDAGHLKMTGNVYPDHAGILEASDGRVQGGKSGGPSRPKSIWTGLQ